MHTRNNNMIFGLVVNKKNKKQTRGKINKKKKKLFLLFYSCAVETGGVGARA